MAEDFDVEAMLEAPYKKGVSYIHNVDNVSLMSANVDVDLYFCNQCFEFFIMIVYLLHIRHGSANLIFTHNTFWGDD